MDGKKPGLLARAKNWCENHAEQLIMAGMFVGGIVVGSMMAGDVGERKGYRKGIRDFAGYVPDMIDYCGKVGASSDAQAMIELAEESGHEDYIITMENLDPYEAGRRAYHKFYDDDGVKGLLKMADDTMEKYHR